MITLKRPAIFLALSAIILITISGCASMAPEYQRPESPVAKNWPLDGSNTQLALKDEKTASDIQWREFFIDPELQKLIELALENSRDLQIAALNIERFAAQYQIRTATLFPTLNATAGANFQRIPEEFSASRKAAELEQYNIGLGVASYELDLFGRVRSLKDQALYQYLATEQAKKSTQITLVSQVAITYLTLQADREHLAISRETLSNQQAAYELVNSRFKAGIATALDLNQAKTTVESAKLDIARYTTVAAQDLNLLELLTGIELERRKNYTVFSEDQPAVKDISVGVNSDVLLSRPDILQSENLLKAANANIGAARAAFFPKIALTTSVGFGSDELAKLFKAGAFAWSIAPNISLPIFDAGTNRANLTTTEVDKKIAVAQYQKAIQTAFREVLDAVAQKETINDQIKAQKALTDATTASYLLSKARFDKGVDSYLTVLDSERSMYSAQQNLISVKLLRLTNLVTLYKVLGGGS